MNDLIKTLRNLLRLGKVDEALALERYLHEKFVKPIETEEHYYESYAKWSGIFDEAGAQRQAEPARGNTVGFVVHSDSPMAHVKALAQLCELRPADASAAIFVLAKDTGALRDVFSKMGVRVYYLARDKDGFGVQIERLRTLAVDSHVGTLVWVSLPLSCAYAFGRRIAERQVFWSQRFHPIITPSIDLYICPGKRTEMVRNWHGQDWRVVHTPLNVEVGGSIAPGHADSSHHVAPRYGTIGREQKIAIPAYLDAVRAILKATGGSFKWTGRASLPSIVDGLKEYPNEFVGWVDPATHIAGLDVYLETFPLGGLCSQVAWQQGVPVVALDNWHSTYGSLEYEGLLSAKSMRDYVDMAVNVANDAQLRSKVVEAQHSALEAEQQHARQDVAKWWEVICEKETVT